MVINPYRLKELITGARRTRVAGSARGAHTAEPGSSDYIGHVVNCETNGRQFVFAWQSAPGRPGVELVCGFAPGAAPSVRIEALLRSGAALRIAGTHIVPSVYKPFEFEVTSLHAQMT
jgi:hypothetical protein